MLGLNINIKQSSTVGKAHLRKFLKFLRKFNSWQKIRFILKYSRYV